MSRRFFVLTVAIAAFYVPLALNYTWPLFAPQMSHWQDAVNTLINGRSYAVGAGSVESVRHGAYTEHRVVLMVHTTLAALALTLGLFQFSPRLRTRRPACPDGGAQCQRYTACCHRLEKPPAAHGWAFRK